MSKKRRSVQLSEEEILRAIRPRALPIFSEDELKVLEELAQIGARTIFSRRGGAQKRRKQSEDVFKRQAILAAEYWHLPVTRRRPLSDPRMIEDLRDILRQTHNIHVSSATVERDVKAIGIKTLTNSASRRMICWDAPACKGNS
jgi:hypothetical protein